MPSDGASKNCSAGTFDRVAVRTTVTRNEFTVLAPNTRVSPSAVICARLFMFGLFPLTSVRMFFVLARFGGRRSNVS